MANREINVRFRVDDGELVQANRDLVEGAKKLNTEYDKLSSGTDKLTQTNRRLYNQQAKATSENAKIARTIKEYAQAQRDLAAAKKAGAYTEKEYNARLAEAQARASKIIRQERAREKALRKTATATKSATSAQKNYNASMRRGVTTSSGFLDVLNSLSFKFFVLTYAVRQMGGVLLRTFVQSGEEITKFRQKFELLAGEDMFDQMYASAQRLGVGVKDLSEVFTRFSIANQSLQLSNEQMLRMTETLTTLGLAGGSSVQELNSGLIQLSQGFASGRLAGEELKSVLENTPLIAFKLAQALGVGVGQLRAMGAAGELTAVKIAAAFEGMYDEVKGMAEDIPNTTDRALQRLGNSWSVFVEALTVNTGIAGGLADAIDGLAVAMDKLVDVLRNSVDFIKALGSALLGAVAGMVAFKAALAAIAIAKFLIGFKAFAATMVGMVNLWKLNASGAALFNAALGPIGLVLAAITGAMVFFIGKTSELKREQEELAVALKNGTAAMREQGEATMANQLLEATKKAKDLQAQMEEVQKQMQWAESNTRISPQILNEIQIKNKAELEGLQKKLDAENDYIEALKKELKLRQDINEEVSGANRQSQEYEDLLEVLTGLASLKERGNALDEAYVKIAKEVNLTLEQRAAIEEYIRKEKGLKKKSVKELKEEMTIEERYTEALKERTKTLNDNTAFEALLNAKRAEGVITLKEYEDLYKKLVGTEAAHVTYAKEMETAQGTLNQIMAQSSDPMVEYSQTLAKIGDIMIEFPELADQAGMAIQRITDDFMAQNDPLKEMREMLEGYGEDMSNILAGVITGSKDAAKSFEDFGRRVVEQITQMIIQTKIIQPLMDNLLGGMGTGGSGSGGFFSQVLGDLFAKAGGGPVTRNGAYLVGESGPELFVPSTNGRIMNNASTATGGTTITMNISTPDAGSFQRSEGQIQASVARMVRKAQRNL